MNQHSTDKTAQPTHLQLLDLAKLRGKAAGEGTQAQDAAGRLAAAESAEDVAHPPEQATPPGVSRHDSTAQEQYYRELFELAPDAYLVTTAQGVIQDANQAATLLLGMPHDWLIGKPCAAFVSKEQGQALQAHLAGLQECAASGEIELAIKPRQGQPFPAAIRIGVGRDSNGGIAFLCWLVRDITERKRAEETQRTEHEIRLQYRAIIVERGRISRELHDSLGQVLGLLSLKTEHVQMLLREHQEKPATKILAEMLEIIRGAYGDVREKMLGLRAAVTPGKEFSTVVAAYLDCFGRDSGIETRLSLPEDVAACLPLLAEVQLLRIIQEALTNVRKHAAARHALVSFCLDGDDLLMTVEDDGKGLPVRENIGAGFGLAIMRERAEAAGGRLTLDSVPGQGTRVCVRLPRHNQQLSEHPK